MTIAIPPVLTRAAFVDNRGFLTREGALYLEAIRGALGGNRATVAPTDAVGSLGPVGASYGPATLPVGPVAVLPWGFADAAPVAVSMAAVDLSPVSVPEVEALP